MGLGVGIELAEGVKFREDVESEEAGLVDDEQGLDFLVDELDDGVANDVGENGARKAFGLDIERSGVAMCPYCGNRYVYKGEGVRRGH